MIEINGLDDLDNYATTRLLKELHGKPKWEFDEKTTIYSYDKAVAFSFSEVGPLYHRQARSFLENDALILRLLYTLSWARKNGKTLEALTSLVESADRAGCAIFGMISPFKMRRKNIYDIKLASNRLSLNQFDLLNPEDAKKTIRGIGRLLRRVGFSTGYRLQMLTKFDDDDFPVERQWVYVPDSLSQEAKDLLEFARSELHENDAA